MSKCKFSDSYNLAYSVSREKDISRCQVSVDEAFLREVVHSSCYLTTVAKERRTADGRAALYFSQMTFEISFTEEF